LSSIIKEVSHTKAPRVQEIVEVKDAPVIFNDIWHMLVAEAGGEENLRFPKEIVWLNGAPGAGKGTNTRFIMEFRDLTAPPIIVSNLLTSPTALKMINQGFLVGDREVLKLVFQELLRNQYQSGAVVDGFPRTEVQVACLKLLYSKLDELRKRYRNTPLASQFHKPQFHIVVLFVDENESVKRQISRGKKMQEFNDKVRLTGIGTEVDVRSTDLDEETAHERYRTFKERTYDPLKSLREIFHYHLINAHGTIEKVQERIVEEMRYQSSLELNEETYDTLSRLPVYSSLRHHARQDLVNRLEEYQEKRTKLFLKVVSVLETKFFPIIRRHAISGLTYINSEDTIFDDREAIAMALDILSERGYRAVFDINKLDIPDRIDLKTGKIQNRQKCVYRIRISFPTSPIRRGQ
jgi:adenylate kinase